MTSETVSGQQPSRLVRWSMRRLRSAGGRRWLRDAALLSAAVIGVVTFGRWLHDRMTHLYVYDARIDAAVVTVSPQVAGRLSAIEVTEGQPVQAGQVLARIDDRQARYSLAAQQARLQAMTARIDTLKARIHLTERQTAAQVAAARARIQAVKAALAAAKSDLRLAETEFERARSLVADGAITRQHFDQRHAALETARQQVARTRAERAQASAAFESAQADREQTAVLRHQLAELEGQRSALRAEIARQEVDIDERRITSPIDGVIDEVFVDPGEYLSPGQRLLLVHDPHEVWVAANVKETAIGGIRVGQKAQVVVDAYPDITLEGRVAYVGDSATSEFALIPNPNPSGNFTKITQRVPIRIAVDNPQELALRPGTMVVAGIEEAEPAPKRVAHRLKMP